ncbi:MAG: hypothetical protein AB1782_15275 [Cyanobacteriota bacterium]
MDENIEKKALQIFQKATNKLFNEKIDDAYYDLCRLITMYPDTIMSMKARILNCIIWKLVLYSECLITETFSNGIKSVQINPILDIFNKDRTYFLSKYERHAKKRRQAFENLKKALKDLLDKEVELEYPVIHMYISLSAERLKGCDPLGELEDVREGKIIPESELQRIIKDLYYYLMVTTISDDFDIEYTDKLSSLSKHKLNRVDLYHSCMHWLNQFYQIEQEYASGELIRKCCVIVLALTKESHNPKRQNAYETLSKMSKDYYTMAFSKEEIEEKVVKDIEEIIFEPKISMKDIKASSLMDLVSIDEKSQTFDALYIAGGYKPLAIEIDLTPSEEMLKAKEELSSEEDKEEINSDFASKLEFD